ncbi:hypothetical protein QJQ45_017098 [Haematococcus lacustris]|nr:hypothetical protein QJQ45_017098 [Haematococcus lacustris]
MTTPTEERDGNTDDGFKAATKAWNAGDSTTQRHCRLPSVEKSPEQIMKEQEALMMAKYGGMKPKKKGLMQAKVRPPDRPPYSCDGSDLRLSVLAKQEHKFFDSADWALNKEAAAKQAPPGAAAPQPVPEEQLKPKLEPTPIPARRVSHLDPMEKIG